MKLTVGGWCFAPPVWTLLLTGLLMALLFRLGLWQLHRADYKQDLIQKYETRAAQAPLDWPGLLAKGLDVLARPVALSGHYDNSRTVLLDNEFEQGRVGYHVLTVFQGAGKAVLVDRGWLPLPESENPFEHPLPVPPAASAVQVVGRVGLPSDGMKVGDEDYHSRPLRVLRVDLQQLGDALGLPLQPYLIRLDSSAPDGFERRWPAVVNPEYGPEKSRGYAFQWFSMMVAVFIIFVVVNSKRIEKT